MATQKKLLDVYKEIPSAVIMSFTGFRERNYGNSCREGRKAARFRNGENVVTRTRQAVEQTSQMSTQLTSFPFNLIPLRSLEVGEEAGTLPSHSTEGL